DRPVASGSMAQGLASIQGLDAEQAIRRLGGRLHLYEGLIRDFQQAYLGQSRSYRDLFAANERTVLNRAIHSLRSSAAYLGAYDLSRRCATLETALEQGGGSAAQLDEIGAELNNLLEQLSFLQAPAAGQSAPPRPAAGSLRQLLEQLLPLLRVSDF